VAIKTLYQTQMKSTELNEFENEVELLRQLHHPNVLPSSFSQLLRVCVMLSYSL
jgi:hypothetical protein